MILNLSNFIHSLLLENETVIIPGFGAFISTYKPAEISETQITPPSKKISFTQQIKNNDGVLVEIIARKAKISQSYAMKRIEKARENMLYELDKGETVIIENIGKLYYNENNEIQFTPFQEDNLLLDSFGLETISVEDSVEETSDIEFDEEAVVPVSEEAEIDKKAENNDVIEPEQISQSTKGAAHSDDQPEILPELEKEIQTEQEQESVAFQLPEFKPATTYQKPEKRKKVAWYWYLLFLIPILIGGYLVINSISKSDNIEIDNSQNTKVEEQGIQVEPVLPIDTIQTDSVLTTKKTSIESVKRESVKSNGITKFYLIGGSFQSEKNAEKYILKLKGKGINGFNLGQKGSLYLVGIDSFDNEPDAQKSLNELVKANPGWNLWIYKKVSDSSEKN